MGSQHGEELRNELRAVLGVAASPGAPEVEVLSSDPEDGYVRHLVRLVTGAPDGLAHLRVDGGHALDAHRFDSIVEWLTAASADR